MESNESNVKGEANKDARIIFILITIGLFVLMILSINSFISTYTNFQEELSQLPLKYSISSILGFLPIILSTIVFVMFVRSMEIIEQNQQIDEENKKRSIFLVTLSELRNPTSRKNKKRKITLIALFLLSVVTLIVIKSYVLIIVYFVV